MLKQIISVITLLAVTISLGCIAFAESKTETKGDFLYVKGSNKITAYIGETGVCEIPQGAEVIKLQNSGEAPITQLIVNRNVTFKNSLSGEVNDFDNLSEVVLKKGVSEIPNQAFAGCAKLKKITIPSTVKEIGSYAFSNCGMIETVKIPNGVQSIGGYAFSYLPSLSGDIMIPDSVVSMGYGAFSCCGDLDTVHLSDNLTFTPTQNYDGSENYANWFDNTHVKKINIPDAMLEKPTCYFYADEITFNSDMTDAIYEVVKNSTWYLNKYLKDEKDEKTEELIATTKPRRTSAPASTPKQKPASEEIALPKSTDKPTETPKPNTLAVGRDMSVSVNGEAVDFPDAKPFIDNNNRTLVPLRFIAETLGDAVIWDDISKTVSIVTTRHDIIAMYIGRTDYTVNVYSESDENTVAYHSEKRRMDTIPVILNDRIYVPIRYAAEAMGMIIEWEG